jgi:hypothetical protein
MTPDASKERKPVGTFDVLKEMCARNMDVRLSTLDNVSELRKVRGGTKVTIGIAGDIVSAVPLGKFVGGLLIADAEQFKAIQKELESR